MNDLSYSEWSRKLNGILLKTVGVGSWQIVEEDTRKPLPLKTWWGEGHSAARVANAIVDMVSLGQARAVKYRKGRRRKR